MIVFGPYRLDRLSGRLLRGGRAVPLRPKVFAVLEHLATHPGRLIPKEELLDAVWPGVHVTPSVLTGCIRELRQALDDDARAARVIETAHRRGYRFIALATPPARRAVAAPPDAPRSGHDGELAALAWRFVEAVTGVMERGRRERAATQTTPAGGARRWRGGRRLEGGTGEEDS